MPIGANGKRRNYRKFEPRPPVGRPAKPLDQHLIQVSHGLAQEEINSIQAYADEHSISVSRAAGELIRAGLGRMDVGDTEQVLEFAWRRREDVNGMGPKTRFEILRRVSELDSDHYHWLIRRWAKAFGRWALGLGRMKKDMLLQDHVINLISEELSKKEMSKRGDDNDN